MPICKTCSTDKPDSAFYVRKDTMKLKSECKDCVKARTKEWYWANPEAQKEWHRQFYADGKKRPQIITKEKQREYNAAKYQRHREKILAGVKQYQLENPAATNARKKAYKEAKRGATPAWLTDQQMLEIEHKYLLAKIHEWVTGMKWHVDHIIPLRGKKVRGLHVPDNLQVILADVNMSKSNRFGE